MASKKSETGQIETLQPRIVIVCFFALICDAPRHVFGCCFSKMIILQLSHLRVVFFSRRTNKKKKKNRNLSSARERAYYRIFVPCFMIAEKKFLEDIFHVPELTVFTAFVLCVFSTIFPFFSV